MTPPTFEDFQRQWAAATKERCQAFLPDAELNEELRIQTEIAMEVVRTEIAESGACSWSPKLVVLGRARPGAAGELTLVAIADGFDTPEHKRDTLYRVGRDAYANDWNAVAAFLVHETWMARADPAALAAHGVTDYTQLPPPSERDDKTEQLTVAGCSIDGRICVAHVPITTVNGAITQLGEPRYHEYDPAASRQPQAFMLNNFWRGVLLGAANDQLPPAVAGEVEQTIQGGPDGRVDFID